MPSYCFECLHCLTVTERDRPMDERDKPLACPECDTATRRLFTAPAVQFRGFGFYSTDKDV